MIPVITLDGPASSGKGTVAKILANELGFNYLESGAIYRALGFWIMKNYPDGNINDKKAIELINKMELSFSDNKVWLNKEDVTEVLRNEKIGMLASKYSAIPDIRSCLLQFQRDFAKAPGLVTDGRDMGSVVFPNADLKIYLTASAEKRAERRYNDLQQRKESVTIEPILQDIIQRDKQDSERKTAPLKYDSSYKILDNTTLTIDETVERILGWFKAQV